MKTLLASAALALALTTSGGAFAATMADSIDLSLYDETNAYVEVKAPAYTGAGYWQTADLSGQRVTGAAMADSRNVVAASDPFYAE
jgi:hypothetical protein